MAFVSSDICFSVVRQCQNISAEEFSTFRTKSLLLKVKLKQTCIAVVGIHRPLCTPKITNDVYILGDCNCDLIHHNKPSLDSRDLNDILDI